MDLLLFLTGLLAALLVVFGAERWVLSRDRARIAERIHVNGSRGKSSTTRLIAAALRQGGLATFAKTTGTLPRFIASDGEESAIVRAGPANIREQIRVFRWLARRRADALVIECMALRPDYQHISEHVVVRSTISVITNVRADHLDVMGPTEADVALALAGTIPRRGLVVTAERRHLALLQRCADARRARLIAVTAAEVDAVSDADMAPFRYYEHKENVALALKVGELLGIDRAASLRGMWAARPDPGALQAFRIDAGGPRRVTFVNGFAANDPESSGKAWQIGLGASPAVTTRRCVLLNLRHDRVDRSRQLYAAVAAWPAVDDVFLMGTGGVQARTLARRQGLPVGPARDFATATAAEILRGLLSLTRDGREVLVVGIGNVAGEGLRLVDLLTTQAQRLCYADFRAGQTQAASAGGNLWEA